MKSGGDRDGRTRVDGTKSGLSTDIEGLTRRRLELQGC